MIYVLPIENVNTYDYVYFSYFSYDKYGRIMGIFLNLFIHLKFGLIFQYYLNEIRTFLGGSIFPLFTLWCNGNHDVSSNISLAKFSNFEKFL